VSLTKDDIESVLHNVLETRSRIDNELHSEHHQFVGMMIAREQRKQERWEKIKTQVFGWGIISILGGIATAVYHAFIKPKSG